MQNIQDKIVLITGGSKGIGYGIAQVLMDMKMRVAITSRSEARAREAAEKLNKAGQGEAIGIGADVRNLKDQVEAVNAVITKWGKLDVLVANAGLGEFVSIEEMTEEQWSETIGTNLTGVFNSVKASIPELKKTGGYIITIGSLAGTNFFAGGSAYNASKFGLVGFSQAIMLDLRHEGIKVSTIMPGSVASFFNNHDPNSGDGWKIQPEDIGELVVDLLQMNPRTLPSKIEVRPSVPPKK
ncbi:MAG: SDR family oxidoreductase [Cyclobacteriaceae bacterium]|nr:SDR family oxidoreductase [Cyclobacteriaceae bacterium]